MTDLTDLIARLAATICSDNEDAAADRCIDVLERWLSDNGLAIVPVKLTDAMWTALFNQSTVDREWADLLKAAPPAADLLRGKTNDKG